MQTGHRDTPSCDVVSVEASADSSESCKAGPALQGSPELGVRGPGLYDPRSTKHWMWAIPEKNCDKELLSQVNPHRG